MIKNFRLTFWIASIILLILSVWPARADEKEDKEKEQAAVLKMRDEALADLYKAKPQTANEIKKAAGYAVFDNTGIHLLMLATSRGNGVAVDNANQRPVFMKMKTIGAGPGLGVKDYRVVFIFQKPETFKKFTEAGWSFTGEADAAAKSQNEGAAAGGGSSASKDFQIYTITKKGVALQATLGGTKFSRDDDLN